MRPQIHCSSTLLSDFLLCLLQGERSNLVLLEELVASLSGGITVNFKKMLPKHERLPACKTFPSPTSTLTYWRKELHPLDSYRSTDGLPEITDIAIIGGGMTGISTAYNILKEHENQGTEPPTITVLEARQLCSGATGRNGGHLKLPLYAGTAGPRPGDSHLRRTAALRIHDVAVGLQRVLFL